MNEVVRTGLVRHDEVKKLGDESSSEMYGSNWWLPLQWSTVIISQAQSKGMIKVAPGFNGLLAQIVNFRAALTSVATYGHIPVPLVYTQVVTLAVYVYFAVGLVGEQWVIWRKRGSDLKPSGDEIDLYYPVFMTVKFLFYFGWLRVADTLYNPFGEDDDDFELNELLNRHFRVAMRIVDDKENPPPLKKDAFWAQDEPELEDFPVWSREYENQVNRDYDTPEGKEREDDTPFDYISVLQQRDPMGHA